MERLSVVVVNHNYERFVGRAIESALALRWQDLEVVVVDDGSTDGSAGVIENYRDRVSVLITDNATQRVAANRGYSMTSGDVVIFLDSDDVLPADLPDRLAAVWAPTVSKVQFRMQRIDEEERTIGTPFPDFSTVPSPGDVRRWFSSTSAYPTPPGSANAYARWFLERVFPVGPEIGDFVDSACLAAAPLCGDVVTVPEVVVGYRRHDANDSDLLADGRRFAREVGRARARWVFARRLASGGGEDIVDESPLYRSRELLQLRVAAHRSGTDKPPLSGDRPARMIRDAVRAPFQPGPETAGTRLIISAWCLAVLVAPRRVARRLLTVRYGR